MECGLWSLIEGAKRYLLVYRVFGKRFVTLVWFSALFEQRRWRVGAGRRLRGSLARQRVALVAHVLVGDLQLYTVDRAVRSACVHVDHFSAFLWHGLLLQSIG